MTTEQKDKKESKYAKKRAAGNMMYGPGCCAHSLTESQMAAIRARAKQRNRQELLSESESA